MKVVVVGGSGHIGTFLVPRLVRAGHEVVSISRSTGGGYRSSPEWQDVELVQADRERDDDGVFGSRLLALRPDVVVDLLCFTLESAEALVEQLRGSVGHLVHCGTLFRYGPSHRLPIREGCGTPPFGEYGIQKNLIANYLKAETAAGGLITTSLHPGSIVGPGWAPLGPVANFSPEVWWNLSAGLPVGVPGSGAELIHHVHADDVAQGFERAIACRDAASGEDFHVVAATALNVRGYATHAAGWFGQQAMLQSVSWDEFRAVATPEEANDSWEHLTRSHCLSIAKAQTLLGYAPRYEPDEAVLESIRWLIENRRITVARPLVV